MKLISYTNFAHLTLKYSLDSNFNKNTFHLLIGIIFNNLEPFKESVFYEFFLHKKALPWYTWGVYQGGGTPLVRGGIEPVNMTETIATFY